MTFTFTCELMTDDDMVTSWPACPFHHVLVTCHCASLGDQHIEWERLGLGFASVMFQLQIILIMLLLTLHSSAFLTEGSAHNFSCFVPFSLPKEIFCCIAEKNVSIC